MWVLVCRGVDIEKRKLYVHFIAELRNNNKDILLQLLNITFINPGSKCSVAVSR